MQLQSIRQKDLVVNSSLVQTCASQRTFLIALYRQAVLIHFFCDVVIRVVQSTIISII